MHMSNAWKAWWEREDQRYSSEPEVARRVFEAGYRKAPSRQQLPTTHSRELPQPSVSVKEAGESVSTLEAPPFSGSRRDYSQ
jgi:hypothetical protein